jgi:hypothetical protein
MLEMVFCILVFKYRSFAMLSSATHHLQSIMVVCHYGLECLFCFVFWVLILLLLFSSSISRGQPTDVESHKHNSTHALAQSSSSFPNTAAP